MALTDDQNDPRLRNTGPDGMQEAYLVLSEEERRKGLVEPVRDAYLHEPCGTVTYMARPLAETYARRPEFYSGTYCAGCHSHFRVGEHGEFVWVENGTPTPFKVGTRTQPHDDDGMTP